jgi:hypothetical protein
VWWNRRGDAMELEAALAPHSVAAITLELEGP